MPPRLCLAGQRFGRLVAESVLPPRNGKLFWSCRCACGATTAVSSSNLRSGKVASCGCSKKDAPTTHGHNRRGRRSPEYRTWATMITRCTVPTCPKWGDYGGRGISVCEKWRLSFVSFLEDMGSRPSPAHSIDRIDNNGNYEPGNCRWATREEQARNKRTTVMLTFRGETRSMAEWASLLGFRSQTIISKRLKRGWSVDDALGRAA